MSFLSNITANQLPRRAKSPMTKLLDRQMFLSYIKSYCVCIVSLIGLFIVVDLFNNLEDFRNATNGFVEMMQYVAIYYAYNTAKIFDRISEAIVLLAAMFSVALMQRNNELLPLLSAGVSTRRVVAPVLCGAMFMLGLSAANQELILPHVDPFLVENRGDPHGNRETEVAGAYDTATGILVTGERAVKKGLLIKDFFVGIPPQPGRQRHISLQAKEAHYIPPSSEKHSGGWLLTSTKPAELDDWKEEEILEWIAPGQYFLYTTEADFDLVTRIKNWQIYTPTWKLLRVLTQDGNKLAAVAVMFHMRLTRPILGMILVFLGLSVILRDQNRNIFISAGLCLLLCGFFFGVCFTCQALGNYEFLSPVMAAWAPVILFGPFSLVTFDAVHT